MSEPILVFFCFLSFSRPIAFMLLLTPQKIWKPNKGTSIHGQCQVGLQAGITKTLRCRETHDRAKGLSWRNRWTLIMQPCLKDLKHQSLETRLQLHGWTHLNELSFTSEPNTGVIFKISLFLTGLIHRAKEERCRPSQSTAPATAASDIFRWTKGGGKASETSL